MSAASRKAYREKHADKVKAQIAAWRKRNPDKIREYSAKRYRLHSERILAAERLKRKLDPNYRKDNYRRSRYKRMGIDPAEALRRRKAHDGICDCCGGTESGGKGWNVDHDHATGRIRGILCHKCNTAIGKLGDTAEGVLRAVRYLTYGPHERKTT